MTDEELMVEYQIGDESAFQEIYSRHVKSLTAYITSQYFYILREDIEDVIQQVFMDFHTQRDRFPKRMKVKPWLRAIARNKVISHLRFESAKCRNKVGIMSSDACQAPNDPGVEAIYRETMCQFDGWLKTKPENWQTMLEPGTAEEVAEKTGVSITSIRHFTREGLAKIKELCA